MAAQVFSCIGSTPASLWRLSTSEFCSSKGVVPPLVVRIRPARRADSVVRAATSNEGEDKKDAVGTSASPVQTESVRASSGENKTVSERRAKAEAEVKRGQTTAIITGAVAVLLGVGYLFLVQILDSRGVILIPPPLEAFDP